VYPVFVSRPDRKILTISTLQRLSGRWCPGKDSRPLVCNLRTRLSNEQVRRAVSNDLPPFARQSASVATSPGKSNKTAPSSGREMTRGVTSDVTFRVDVKALGGRFPI
jgi:hypothetical protein